jgi:hypothetical protein
MLRDSKLSPLFLLVPAATILLLAARAEGSLVRYDFTGHINQLTATGRWPSTYDFRGTLIYDDSIALGAPHKNLGPYDERSYTSGAYRPTDPTPDGTSLQLWIDGKAVAPESTGLSGGLFSATGDDGVTRSDLVFYSHARDERGYLDRGGISISFKVDPSLMDSGRFPEGLTVADLPDAHVGINSVMDGRYWGEVASGFNYGGPVDSFAIAPVPEPAWTVAALLAATVWTARRRRARGWASPDHSS